MKPRVRPAKEVHKQWDAVYSYRKKTLEHPEWKEGVLFALRWVMGYTHGGLAPIDLLRRKLKHCRHPKETFLAKKLVRGSYQCWFYCKRCKTYNAGEQLQTARPAGIRSFLNPVI